MRVRSRRVDGGITILRDKRIQYWRVALLHLAINVELHCIASFNTSLHNSANRVASPASRDQLQLVSHHGPLHRSGSK